VKNFGDDLYGHIQRRQFVRKNVPQNVRRELYCGSVIR
jgi:hypothetical protein